MKAVAGCGELGQMYASEVEFGIAVFFLRWNGGIDGRKSIHKMRSHGNVKIYTPNSGNEQITSQGTFEDDFPFHKVGIC